MSYSNFSNNDNYKIKTKPCGWKCGKEIYWNVAQATYYEADTNQKHVCPNRNQNLVKPDSVRSSYQPQRKWVQAKQQTKEEKPPVSNSFELLQGSPRSVRKQYQKLVDLIDEAKGKIHGSQSHFTNTGLKMLIYFEVPVAFREALHVSFDEFLEREVDKS